MFEHWQQLTYFDNETSVFPSDELLDMLQLHDTAPRKHVFNALNGLVSDFNELLVESEAYDWFCYNGYQRVAVNKECLLFS